MTEVQRISIHRSTWGTWAFEIVWMDGSSVCGDGCASPACSLDAVDIELDAHQEGIYAESRNQPTDRAG